MSKAGDPHTQLCHMAGGTPEPGPQQAEQSCGFLYDSSKLNLLVWASVSFLRKWAELRAPCLLPQARPAQKWKGGQAMA